MSIRIEHLKFTYFEDRKDVLSDLSAEFDAGEITILTGRFRVRKVYPFVSGGGNLPAQRRSAALRNAGGGGRSSGQPDAEETVYPGGHDVPEPGAAVLYGYGGA